MAGLVREGVVAMMKKVWGQLQQATQLVRARLSGQAQAPLCMQMVEHVGGEAGPLMISAAARLGANLRSCGVEAACAAELERRVSQRIRAAVDGAISRLSSSTEAGAAS